MTKEQLIQYKLNQFLGRRDGKGMTTFILSLLANQTQIFQSILDEMKVDATRRLEQLADVQNKTQASATALSSVDVNNIQ